MVAAAIAGCLFSPLGIIGLLLVVMMLLYLKFSYFPFQVLENTGIKGPCPSFFFGNYRAMAKLGFLKYLKHLHEKYGRIVSFYIGVHPCISVTDTDLIKLITVKDFDHFVNREKAPDFFGRKPDETKGLAEDRDDVWRVGRRTLSPTFSSAKIKAMTPLIQSSVKTLVEVFKEHADSEKSFKIVEIYRRFTMETIFATAFGRVIDIQRNKSDPLVEAGATIFGTFTEDSSGGEFFMQFLMLLYNLPWLEPISRFVSRKSAHVKAFKLFTKTAIQLIKERRAETEPGRYKDLLQLMIDATVEEGESSQKKLTDEEITAHATVFMLAGYETTSNSLTFTSYLLALNPDIQEKLQEEIDRYFGENPEASLYQAAQDIGYLDMVIQETARLYTVVAEIERDCDKDYTYKDITIPKGTTVVFPVAVLHKDPEYWEDPEKFDPMRFTAEEKAKRPQQCYLPFGAGPRSCIGMRFALLEQKMALIELLKEFTFVRAPDTAMSLELGVIGSKTPVYLKVVKRNKINS